MALSLKQVTDVCYGNSAQSNPYGWYSTTNVCKYLTHATINKKSVSLCLKKAPGILQEMAVNGQLPPNFDKMKDNCPGFRYLKYVEQGYDVK